jgi:hypothetical protein
MRLPRCVRHRPQARPPTTQQNRRFERSLLRGSHQSRMPLGICPMRSSTAFAVAPPFPKSYRTDTTRVAPNPLSCPSASLTIWVHMGYARGTMKQTRSDTHDEPFVMTSGASRDPVAMHLGDCPDGWPAMSFDSGRRVDDPARIRGGDPMQYQRRHQSESQRGPNLMPPARRDTRDFGGDVRDDAHRAARGRRIRKR